MIQLIQVNKVNKRRLLVGVLALLLIVSMQNILALGITPGRTTINFEPGLNQEVSFSVINSGHKDMSVVFMIRGNLSEYVTMNTAYAEFSADEESKSFSYTVNLPERIETLGKHEIEIVAVEMPKDFKETGTMIGSTLAVVTQLHVYVAYPNKYVEGNVNVVESDGEMVFFIPVVSRGKLDIVHLEAKIDIYSWSDEKVASLVSNSDLERKELVARWNPEVAPGKYKAVVNLIYDEEVSSFEKEFNVGEMLLEIKEIVVRDFRLGEIAKFNTLVENKWSNDLKDVYLNIIVYNNEGEVMADFKSPSYNVESLSQKEIISYWDTGGVHKGTYDGKLFLIYGEKSTERNIQLRITDDEIEIIGITGKVVVKGESKLNLTNILIGVVLVLIVMNVVWFFIIKKLLKKR